MVAEKYDEVVFTNPKAEFHRSLLEGGKKKEGTLPYPISNEKSVAEHFRTYGDEGDVKAMLAAKRFLEGELRDVKDRLARVDGELDEVRSALADARRRQQAGTGATAQARQQGGDAAAAASTAEGAATGKKVGGGGGASTGGGGSAAKGAGAASKAKKHKKKGAPEGQPSGKKLKTSA